MIDTLLNEIAQSGWLLNNLFQLNSGTWQANLRSATHHTAWARGPTAFIALSLAMDEIAQAIESEIASEPTHTTHEIAPKVSLSALLSNLRRPSAPIFHGRL